VTSLIVHCLFIDVTANATAAQEVRDLDERQARTVLDPTTRREAGSGAARMGSAAAQVIRTVKSLAPPYSLHTVH
jgi:hypothetical protein